MSSNVIVIAVAVFIWFITARPLIALLMEYGFHEGFFYARLYSHFFLFPYLFGHFLLIALIQPVSLVLDFFIASGSEGKVGLTLYLGAIVGVSIILSVIEMGNRRAVWEVKKDVLKQDQDMHGEKSVRALTFSLAGANSSAKTAEKIGYNSRISEMLSENSAKSRVYRAYRLAFLPFTMIFLSGYITTIVFAVRPESIAAFDPVRHEIALRHLVIAALLLFAWPIMRIYYDIEINSLFSSDKNESAQIDGGANPAFSFATLLITFVFAVGYIYLFIALFPSMKGEILAIATGAIQVLALLVALLRRDVIYQVGRWVWGVRASVLSYAMLLTAFLLVILYFGLDAWLPA